MVLGCTMMPFFLQYMFMFQVPRLLLGLRDHSAIKYSFTGQFGVSWTTVNRWCLCLCIYTHCAAYVCACVCMNYCLFGAHISVTDAEFGYFTSTPSLPPSLPPFPSSLSLPSLLPLLSPSISQGVKNKASFPPDVVEAYKYSSFKRLPSLTHSWLKLVRIP